MTGVILAVTAMAAPLFGPLNDEPVPAADTVASVTVATTTAPELDSATPTSAAGNGGGEAEVPADDTAPETGTDSAEDDSVFIEPTGVVYTIPQLTLASDGIGELAIGDPSTEVLASLTASLGQPDADSGEYTSAGEHGTCAGDTIRTVNWGPLTVIVGGLAESVFLGYGLDVRGYTGASPATDMQTLSGLGVGDSIAGLQEIYAGSYEVEFANRLGDGPIYRIQSVGTLLLWGPVTSGDSEGKVQGVYSTLLCER